MNMAALLSRMSTLPKVSSASFTIAAQSSSFDTSWRMATAWPPASWISFAVSCAPASLISPTTRLAPSRASNCAVTRPMPELPAPVMIATLPATRAMIISPCFWL